MQILILNPCVQDAFFFFFFYALLPLRQSDCFDRDHGDIPQQAARSMQLGIPFLVIYPFFFCRCPSFISPSTETGKNGYTRETPAH